MIEVSKTPVFDAWMRDLRDDRAFAKINVAIDRMRLGNFGDSKSVGEGVLELRIDYGPGYRLYFARKGKAVVLLLCGGDKSTQAADIRKAKTLS